MSAFTASTPASRQGTPPPVLSSRARGLRERLGLIVLMAAGLALGGCVSPYYPTGVVYSPAPEPSAGTPGTSYPAQQGNGQVVHSVQVPQSSMPPNGGFSVAEILTQAKGGRPVPELVSDIRARGLNAPLKQADIDLLASNGVAREIVDAALAAPVNTVAADNPQVVTRAYYYYPWVPFTLGLYWGAWRPFHYPYYSYSPRYYGHSAPRYYGGGSFRSLPPSGWGGRGRRFR